MVTLEQILPILQQNAWFAVIDLIDAYFHITICQDIAIFSDSPEEPMPTNSEPSLLASLQHQEDSQNAWHL